MRDLSIIIVVVTNDTYHRSGCRTFSHGPKSVCRIVLCQIHRSASILLYDCCRWQNLERIIVLIGEHQYYLELQVENACQNTIILIVTIIMLSRFAILLPSFVNVKVILLIPIYTYHYFIILVMLSICICINLYISFLKFKAFHTCFKISSGFQGYIQIQDFFYILNIGGHHVPLSIMRDKETNTFLKN